MNSVYIYIFIFDEILLQNKNMLETDFGRFNFVRYFVQYYNREKKHKFKMI